MEENKIVMGNLSVSSAPHMVTKHDTAWTMQQVLIAICPAILASTFIFGFRVLAMTAICVAGCFFEWGYEKLLKKPITVQDFSACVTGAILACNLPSGFPFWMAVIGCFVSIVVVKMLYGGLGRNFANPAIVGRIVLLLSFTSEMTTWPSPRGVDAATGATPLALLADGSALTDLKSLLLGLRGGAMGEVCAIALILGGIYLIARKVISPIIPCTFIGTVFVIALIYYSVVGGDYSPLYMACYHVLSGGLILGAFFCATDYVTSPVMPQAKYIFGFGCGAVTMIVRLMASYPEGVSFAILFMNIMTPLLDRVVIKKYYKKMYGPKEEAK